MPWVESRDYHTSGLRFTREDGAVVKYHMGPPHMPWIAFEPNPSEDYLGRTNSRGISWPRRWRTAEAAMRAVDREYPPKHAPHQ